MGVPRFLLVTGRTISTLTMTHWPNGWGQRAGAAGPDGTWLAWRLAGANNRELGRSARIFPDLTACVASIVELRGTIENLLPIVAMDYVTGGWGWRLDLNGQTVAVSSRIYQRERECRHNLAQFLSAVPTAAIPQDART